MCDYKNIFDLSGCTAVITGGSGMLGCEFAKGLASYGANIALVDLDLDRCQNLAQEFTRQFKIKAKGYSCDITQEDQVNELADNLLEDFPSVDILINNAAVQPPGFFASLGDYPLAAWQKVLDVNMTAVFLMIKYISPHMQKRKQGNIINISSIYGVVAPDQRIYQGAEYRGNNINTPLVYSATKGAIIQMTRHLATYFAADGIRVNCITPGGVYSGQNETFVGNYSKRVPLGRMADRHEITGAVIYLASPASSYMTGQNIILDGGLTVW